MSNTTRKFDLEEWLKATSDKSINDNLARQAMNDFDARIRPTLKLSSSDQRHSIDIMLSKGYVLLMVETEPGAKYEVLSQDQLKQRQGWNQYAKVVWKFGGF